MGMKEEEFYEEIGSRVRAMRNTAGLTQLELSRLVKKKVGRPQITNIENGNHAGSAYTIACLVAACGCKLSDFYNPEVEM